MKTNNSQPIKKDIKGNRGLVDTPRFKQKIEEKGK